MLRRVLVARLNLDLQHQPQIGQHVAVIGMRRPTRFLRVVTDHRSINGGHSPHQMVDTAPTEIAIPGARGPGLTGIPISRTPLIGSYSTSMVKVGRFRSYSLSQRRAKPSSPCGMKITIATKMTPTG